MDPTQPEARGQSSTSTQRTKSASQGTVLIAQKIPRVLGARNKEPQNHRTKEPVHEGLTHTKVVKLFKLIVTKITVFLVTKHLSRGDMFDHLQDHSRVTEN